MRQMFSYCKPARHEWYIHVAILRHFFCQSFIIQFHEMYCCYFLLKVARSFVDFESTKDTAKGGHLHYMFSEKTGLCFGAFSCRVEHWRKLLRSMQAITRSNWFNSVLDHSTLYGMWFVKYIGLHLINSMFLYNWNNKEHFILLFNIFCHTYL
jgi:hypothetical protein